jgi:hypothetical protein
MTQAQLNTQAVTETQGVIEPVMSFGRLSWAVAIDQQFMAD